MLRPTLFTLCCALSLPAFGNSLFNPGNGKLFIPYILVGEQVFDAELSLSADTGLLEITRLRQRHNNPAPAYGQGVRFSPDGVLKLPRIHVDGALYQADLTYLPNSQALTVNNILPVDDDLPQRGAVLSNSQVDSYTQLQLSQILTLFNLQRGLNIDLQIKNGIAVHKLVYRTIDPAGELTRASALLILPLDTASPRPLMAVQHGTQVMDSEALTEELADAPAFGLAANGYVVVAADYLGFGESAGLHPYVHARSLASAVVDALRAARLAAGEQGVPLNRQLFLAGYSEGGYATLAVQRELETYHADEFSITASAPMAGPYDLSGSMVQRVLDATPHPNPYYFPYITLMLQRVYGLFDGLGEAFTAPYDTTILDYFDGQRSDTEINAYLPASHLSLFQPQVYADLANPDSWIAGALRENDLLRWRPEAPTRLYHCVADEQVPFANSQAAYDSFKALGAAQVELVAVEDSALNRGRVHANCSIPLMLMAKEWLDSLL